MPVLLSDASCAVPVTNSKSLNAFVALMAPNDRTPPTQATFTVITSAAAKGATTINVSVVFAGTATETKMIARQPLRFKDPATDLVYMAYLSADNDGTGTTLTVTALDEEIPVGAIAVFPVEISLRNDLQVATSVNVNEADTLDHKIADATPNTKSITNTLPGLYTHYCAGIETCIRAEEAAPEQGKEVYLKILHPRPSNVVADFAEGAKREGFFFITGTTEGAANGSNASIDFTGRMTDYTRTLPVAA